jgi:RNA polymerase sigma factor (sigma-70 family)
MLSTKNAFVAEVRPAHPPTAPGAAVQGRNDLPLESNSPFTKLLRRLAREQRVPRDQVTDFVQEAWLRMLTHFPQAANQQLTASLTAWLQRLVRSLAVDWHRHEQRYQTRCPGALVEAVLDDKPDADPARHLDRCLDRELVERFLGQLQQEVSAENYRLFWLHWIDEQPVAALGLAFHLGPAEISARLHRMLKRMQAYAASYRSEYVIPRPQKPKD